MIPFGVIIQGLQRVMKLNTAQIPPGESALKFSSELDAWVQGIVKKLTDSGYPFSSPMDLDLRLTKLDPDYYLKGNLAATITQPCARCSENFSLKLNHRFEIAFTQVNFKKGRFAPGPDTDELDINFFDGHIIELAPVIEEQFLLAIPFKAICRESCTGICQRCGVNRNIQPCICATGIAENAFQTLKVLKV